MGVGDVAEDVLGEQRRSEREGDDSDPDRGPQKAWRQRRGADDDREVGEEGEPEEAVVGPTSDADAVAVKTEDPTRSAGDRPRNELGAGGGERDRGDRQPGKAEPAEPASAQRSPPMPPLGWPPPMPPPWSGGAGGDGAGSCPAPGA